MEQHRGEQYPPVVDEPDDMMREPLFREPTPTGQGQPPKALILSGLALMLVVAVVVTTAGVLQGLRSHSSGTAAARTATATAFPTARPVPTDPKASGWTAFSPVLYSGDVKFAPSSPQRGYICGQGESQRIFGFTADGGQSWRTTTSPAKYSSCALQISPSNPLDVTLTSTVDAGQAPDLEAHYSADGGATWKAVPFPSMIVPPGGDLWAGNYVYAWAGPSRYGEQKNYLAVSTNGGGFTTLDTSKLLAGSQGVTIEGALSADENVYLNLSYTCGAAQPCQAIVFSANGGKAWTRIPNNNTIQLVGVTQGYYYGWASDPQNPKAQVEMVASGNDATWTPLKLPPIPGLPAGTSAPLSLPASDGTHFAAPDHLGVAYLHGSTWTLLPFSRYGEGIHVAVAVDASGKPTMVWAIDDGNDSAAGIYSQPLP